LTILLCACQHASVGRGGPAPQRSRFLGDGQCPTRCPVLSPVGGRLSVQAISWVIEHSHHKGNSFVVLLMIANHARSDGTGAWPSIPTLAKESRIAERTVQRIIHRLTRWQHNFKPELIIGRGKGPRGTNLYTLPGVKLSPPLVSDSVTPLVSRMSPEPSFNRPKSNTKAAQPQRVTPSPKSEREQRRIVTEQERRLQKEADARREVQAGRNWISDQLEKLRKAKGESTPAS
jgi:hypothetical protein